MRGMDFFEVITYRLLTFMQLLNHQGHGVYLSTLSHCLIMTNALAFLRHFLCHVKMIERSFS